MMDDFVADSAAEVRQISGDAMIGEPKDRDRVAADERSGERAFDQYRRFAMPEHRRVTAFRQVDDQYVSATFLTVMLHKFCAQPASLDANDGVGARIEGLFLPEHLNANHVFLQLVAMSGDRLLHDEGQEPFETIALLEGRTRQDPLE